MRRRGAAARGGTAAARSAARTSRATTVDGWPGPRPRCGTPAPAPAPRAAPRPLLRAPAPPPCQPTRAETRNASSDENLHESGDAATQSIPVASASDVNRGEKGRRSRSPPAEPRASFAPFRPRAGMRTPPKRGDVCARARARGAPSLGVRRGEARAGAARAFAAGSRRRRRFPNWNSVRARRRARRGGVRGGWGGWGMRDGLA